MPSIKYLLQGLEASVDHLDAILDILLLDNIKRIMISVAFVRESGINHIMAAIKPFNKKVDFIIGVRNGITSIQAIRNLLKNGFKPIVVDTASSSTTYHPKIFLSYSETRAKAIIGSANLTTGGLITNIEASTIIELNLEIPDEKLFLEKILDSFKVLANNSPDNVFRINSLKQANKLFVEGRLIDEEIITRSGVKGKKLVKKVNDIKKIKLSFRAIKLALKKPPKKPSLKRNSIYKTQLIPREEWRLVWESKPLSERDLNIPTGTSTHSTGSMLLKQGNMIGIDFRHYFKEIVFDQLNWEKDPNPKKSHLLRTYTKFRIIINEIDYGEYTLKLTHNSRTDTLTYKQKNAMTQLHWGDIKSIVAKRDLLGSILKLYRPENNLDVYLLEIQ